MTIETDLQKEALKEKQFSLKQEIDRWKNRRRMAWTALCSILVVTVLVFYSVPLERVKVLDNVITWFYTIQGTVVCSYIGAVTFSEKWENKK